MSYQKVEGYFCHPFWATKALAATDLGNARYLLVWGPSYPFLLAIFTPVRLALTISWSASGTTWRSSARCQQMLDPFWQCLQATPTPVQWRRGLRP